VIEGRVSQSWVGAATDAGPRRGRRQSLLKGPRPDLIPAWASGPGLWFNVRPK
jgi:hypothetical protein